ncbi:MAG: hypothetical protein H0X47_09155 [Nitrospirales bacterium]|nr:hypothetical protein [Nitrospirales bacterium]
MAIVTKVLIQLPVSMKKKLDALKVQGYTASGFIRALLEKEFAAQLKPKKKGA